MHNASSVTISDFLHTSNWSISKSNFLYSVFPSVTRGMPVCKLEFTVLYLSSMGPGMSNVPCPLLSTRLGPAFWAAADCYLSSITSSFTVKRRQRAVIECWKSLGGVKAYTVRERLSVSSLNVSEESVSTAYINLPIGWLLNSKL